MRIDASDIKLAAHGRWREILIAIGGVPAKYLDGRNHPCPKCGGMDRFSLLDESRGAVLCRKCFDTKNGDGIAAVQWLLDIEFQDALRAIADHLHVKPLRKSLPPPPVSIDPVAHLAAVKKCSEHSLREYGAEVGQDRRSVVFPAYGPERVQCTTFAVWPGATGKPNKGLFEKGKKAGLFFPLGDQGPRFPLPDDTWIICEGVKDAAAYHSLGFQACGLNTDHLGQKFVPLFQGVHVTLVPDRTTDAEAKARLSAGRLAGVAASVKIGTLPLPLDNDRGDDVRDALKQRDGEQLVRTAMEQATAWSAGDGADEPTDDVRRITMQQAVAERVSEYRKGPIPRVQLGIPKLDRTLGNGVPFGSFVIVGALSSHGKTAFSLQVAHRITGVQKIPVTFISVEMGIGELADRALSYASEAPKEEWHRLLEQLECDAAKHFQDAAPCVLVEGVSSLDEIKREITNAFESGYRVAVIDYAQLISASSRDDTNAIVRRVSATFKQVAKKHNAIVICLAQLNKRVEERKPLIPRLTDIEYGSKLGHDADVVLFLVWPHRIDQSKPLNEYQVFIEKNRNGRSKVAINGTSMNIAGAFGTFRAGAWGERRSSFGDLRSATPLGTACF